MIDFAAIEREVEDGFVYKQRHPTAPLSIYNYAPRAQWENHWTPETMICRGLIVHDDGRIVARPFPKFFNYDQVLDKIPNEPFEVTEKMDGSLGISYWDGETNRIATRGSFTSEQAIVATKLLGGRHAFPIFPKDLTLLFEIIYPANRIVVNYADREELVLLAAIHTESGREIPYGDLCQMGLGFNVVRRLDGIADLSEILNVQKDNFEGFVVRFQNGFRCKIKLAEYVRLHKLLTGITPRSIWEELRSGRGIEGLIDRVPDEFMRWLRSVEGGINLQFNDIKSECQNVFRGDFPSRRDAAEYFKKQKYPGVLFRMLDNKPVDDMIWKLIYPPAAAAFRCQPEAIA